MSQIGPASRRIAAEENAHDPLDDAACAAVDQPDPRARGQAVSGIRDRQPAARQVAGPPPFRRLLPPVPGARVRADRRRAPEGRSRRDAVLEPLRPPRVLLRHPRGRRRDAHAEPAPVARGDRLDRQPRAGPVPDRRRRAPAALRAVQGTGTVREGGRRAAHPQVGCGAARGLRGVPQRRAGAIRVRAARGGRPDRHVLHVRDDRAAEGRRVLAPLDRDPHARGEPAGSLGTLRARLGAARHADVPRELLGCAVRVRNDGHQAGLSRPAPRARGPAGPDGAGEADLRPRRADDLARHAPASRRAARPPQAAAGHAHARRRRAGARSRSSAPTRATARR